MPRTLFIAFLSTSKIALKRRLLPVREGDWRLTDIGLWLHFQNPFRMFSISEKKSRYVWTVRAFMSLKTEGTSLTKHTTNHRRCVTDLHTEWPKMIWAASNISFAETKWHTEMELIPLEGKREKFMYHAGEITKRRCPLGAQQNGYSTGKSKFNSHINGFLWNVLCNSHWTVVTDFVAWNSN
jgi:hypothetical protein